MIATPMMCHATLMSLRIATRRTPNVLSRPWTTRIRPNRKIVCPGVALKSNCRSSRALRKNAAPKSMPAVTATWPRKLNQPVNHDHAGPLRGANLADQ